MGVLTKEELELEYKAGVKDTTINLTVEHVIKSMKSYGVDVEEAMSNLEIDQSIRNMVRCKVMSRLNADN